MGEGLARLAWPCDRSGPLVGQRDLAPDLLHLHGAIGLHIGIREVHCACYAVTTVMYVRLKASRKAITINTPKASAITRLISIVPPPHRITAYSRSVTPRTRRPLCRPSPLPA